MSPAAASVTADVSHSVESDRLAQQVQQLQEKYFDSMRVADEVRELRQLVERTRASSQDFRLILDAEVTHRQHAVEAEHDLRCKDFAETQAALSVTRGRLSVLEGTTGAHSAKLKELSCVIDQVQTLQHRLEALELSTAAAEIERKAAAELLEGRVKDEFSIMATALEVKSQDTIHKVIQGMEQLEVAVHGELSLAGGASDAKLDQLRRELCVEMNEKDQAVSRALEAQQVSLRSSLVALENNFNDEKDGNLAKFQETQQAATLAVDAAIERLRELTREVDAQHTAQSRQIQLRNETDGKLLEEISRLSREGDLKLERLDACLHSLVEGTVAKFRATQDSMNAKFQDEFASFAQENDAQHRRHSSSMRTAIDALDSKLWEFNKITMDNDAKHSSHYVGVSDALRNAEVVLTERFEAHQHTLQQNIESMFDRVRQESTQVADNTMLRVAELRESHNADIARHKELLDRVRMELSQHGLAVNSATSGLEALEKRISEVRDERCLEVEDLGAALYAIQAHLSHTPVLVRPRAPV